MTIFFIKINMEYIKRFFLLGFILIVYISCQKESDQQIKWESFNLNYHGDFSDIVAFQNDTLMLLSSLDSTFQKTCIFESDDAGITWSRRCFDKLVIGGFSNFYCFNHLKIFAGNYRSYDGGNNWQMVGDFAGSLMHFFNNDIGIAFSGFSIYKTFDGGNSFIIVYDITSYVNCQFVQFLNNQVGYASGGASFDNFNSGVILKSTDGGDTWESLPGTFKSIIGMSFITTEVGFIIINLYEGDIISSYKEGAELLRTTDGGKTWKSINNQLYDLFNIIPWGCYFSDERHGYIYGSTLNGSKILSTSDGGQRWKEEYTSPTNESVLTKIIFTSSEGGYAVGKNGLFLKRIKY
jgi:photosystem II stability/assembly factor-like uncharacterized protein